MSVSLAPFASVTASVASNSPVSWYRLREDEEDRELYVGTKRGLASRDWPTMQHYADAKTAIIEDILARASRSSREGG